MVAQDNPCQSATSKFHNWIKFLPHLYFLLQYIGVGGHPKSNNSHSQEKTGKPYLISGQECGAADKTQLRISVSQIRVTEFNFGSTSNSSFLFMCAFAGIR